MPLTALAIGSIVAGAAGGIAQGIGASKQAKAQSEAARKSGEAGKDFVKSQLRSLGDFGDTQRGLVSSLGGAFRRADNVFNFLSDSDDSLGALFDSETLRKRENLDFVVPEDTEEDLRLAQEQNAELAAGNFSGFLDSLRADTLGILANTEGRPVGAFENLSASNQLLARTRGLSNALAISDFFSREGTVDPPTALSVFGAAQGVAEFEANQNAQELAFRERQLDRSLGIESALFSSGFEIERLGLLSEANALQGAAGSAGVGLTAFGSGLQGISQGLGAGYQLAATNAANAQNQANQKRALDLLERSINTGNTATASGLAAQSVFG